MIITEQIRNKIIPNLPRDFSKQVQELTGCSANTVTNVLKHQSSNYEVAKALINIAAIHSKKLKKLKKKALELDTKAKAA